MIVARRTSLVASRRSLERAAIALSMYYRQSDGAPRVPSSRRVPLDTPAPPAFAVSLPREVREAWSRRPETERYRALLDRQRVSVDHAENQLAPRIDITLGGSVDLGAGPPDRQEVLGQPVLEGSVLVSMPFQFREARGGIQQRRAELGALTAEAQLVSDRIRTEVQDAASAVRAAEEGVALATEAAEVAEAVAEAERRRFELGATQLFTVNLREESAAAARAVLVDAEAALQLAHAQWRAVTAAD
ncbi:MAG: TolC family protein [Sandaracinaceae bacterium]